MKRLSLFALTILGSVFFISCDKQMEDEIIHNEHNQIYIMPRTQAQASSGNDQIALHVDSIINGHIQTDLISSGMLPLDVNEDGITDFRFEILNLLPFNNNSLPAGFDSLAVRVTPVGTEILDNSTYGYPDALGFDANIDDSGNWETRTSVLGTFLDAGQFKGAGTRYLGFRIPDQQSYQYGWIKLSCSIENDTLSVYSYAFNSAVGNAIDAGQTQ